MHVEEIDCLLTSKSMGPMSWHSNEIQTGREAMGRQPGPKGTAPTVMYASMAKAVLRTKFRKTLRIEVSGPELACRTLEPIIAIQEPLWG